MADSLRSRCDGRAIAGDGNHVRQWSSMRACSSWLRTEPTTTSHGPGRPREQRAGRRSPQQARAPGGQLAELTQVPIIGPKGGPCRLPPRGSHTVGVLQTAPRGRRRVRSRRPRAGPARCSRPALGGPRRVGRGAAGVTGRDQARPQPRPFRGGVTSPAPPSEVGLPYPGRPRVPNRRLWNGLQRPAAAGVLPTGASLVPVTRIGAAATRCRPRTNAPRFTRRGESPWGLSGPPGGRAASRRRA